MNAHHGFRKAGAVLILGASAVLLAPLLGAADAAAPLAGALRGVTVDAAGTPLAGVHVIIHSPDGSDERELLSRSDGTFSTGALKPGTYRLTASKGELNTPNPTAVEIAPNETSNASVKLAKAGAGPPLTEREEMLLARIDRLEERLAAMEAAQKPVNAATAMAASNPAAARAEAERPAPSAAEAPTAAGAMPAATVAKLEPPAGQLPAQAGGKPTVPPPAAPVAPPAHVLPEALEAPDATPGVDNFTPFAYGDFTWLNGNPRT